mmetsp:Transcript_83449/g.194006  ORF Transcript_83449/g.194006 Transcript_83449/m.194006 type:complete len:162 (-) Transcript_83449:141-626(-)
MARPSQTWKLHYPGAGLSAVPRSELRRGSCQDNEEPFHGRCYKKCSLLTQEDMPVRTSPWSCCRRSPCHFEDQRIAAGFCSGFDVGGDGHCPRAPRSCALDEELTSGKCYRKCSLLTEGVYPHRVSANTCCRVRGITCLKDGQRLRRESFDTGGAGAKPKL